MNADCSPSQECGFFSNATRLPLHRQQTATSPAETHSRQLSQFEIAPTDCPPRIGGQRDREADPARGGSYSQGKLFDLATTPALRATPPVPGGEPGRKKTNCP